MSTPDNYGVNSAKACQENKADFVSKSDNKKKCCVKTRNCKRKDHGTLPGKKKKEQENNMSFLTFCSLSKVGARMKINKVVHIHGNELTG